MFMESVGYWQILDKIRILKIVEKWLLLFIADGVSTGKATEYQNLLHVPNRFRF